MKWIACVTFILLPLSALASTYEYGALLISESRYGGAGLLVRLDTATGPAFFCHEKYTNFDEKYKVAWPACISALNKVTGTSKATDVLSGGLTFEPLTLSLLGRRGWEVISSSVETQDYNKDTRYLLKRTQ